MTALPSSDLQIISRLLEILEASKGSVMVRHYNFGIEIEAVAKPYGSGECFSNVDWYRQLAQKLRNRGISAVHDDNSRYSKHPEYYGGKWFVTREGSLKRERQLGIKSSLQL